MIYELCSGATPCANVRGNHVELYEAVMSVDVNGGVWCPHWFDADTVDIVRKLLRLDELARLGAGGGTRWTHIFRILGFTTANSSVI